MYSVWTKHLKDPEEKAQFEKNLRNSKWILDKLDEILLSMETSLRRSEISPASYDSPNWAYRQAHSNGFLQSITSVRRLINLDQRDKDDRSTTI